MRWKLLIIASTLAALAGAGASLAATHYFFGAAGRVASPDWAVASTFLLPLAATTYAAVFVYRRTSRRRALQAAATAMLALLLTLAFFIASSIYFGPDSLRPDPAPPQPVANKRD